MARNPILSPTHADNDVLILDGVLAGVVQQGAQYGLSKPRRDLLALTLKNLIRSCREGWEEQFLAAMHALMLIQIVQTGRPSQPEGGPRRGDTHLPDSSPRLTG